MDTLEQALEWHSKGITPIPCNGKIARIPWRNWQSKLPPQWLVEVWFRQPANLGLLCGGSAGLVVLDFDDVLVYGKWRLQQPGYRDSYTVSTPRPGRHVYFFTSEVISTALHPIAGVDVKAQGGYVLCPPSQTTGAYTVLQDSEIMHIDNLACVLGNSVGNSVETQYKKVLPQPIDLIAQIKAKLPILNLVSRHCEPIPSSRDGRYFVASCPFHAPDNKPSFWIDTQMNICGCFKPECQAKQPYRKPMDVFNFYARLHGCCNTQAICDLAKELGLWQERP